MSSIKTFFSGVEYAGSQIDVSNSFFKDVLKNIDPDHTLTCNEIGISDGCMIRILQALRSQTRAGTVKWVKDDHNSYYARSRNTAFGICIDVQQGTVIPRALVMIDRDLLVSRVFFFWGCTLPNYYRNSVMQSAVYNLAKVIACANSTLQLIDPLDRLMSAGIKRGEMLIFRASTLSTHTKVKQDEN